MKIGILSDLHIDINKMFNGFNEWGFISQLKDLDLLFICGDISGSFTFTSRFLNELRRYIDLNGYKVKVFAICGNHEGYEYNIENIPKTTGILKLREEFNTGSVVFLENHIEKYKDYIIFGCCLYTDFGLYGNHERVYSMNKATSCMNDFRYVYDYDDSEEISKITTKDYENKFNKSLNILKTVCEKYKDKKILVLTHFCPSKSCISPEYVGDILNPAYASNLDDFISENKNIKLWSCGHCHHKYISNIDECNIIMNPFGYYQYEGEYPPSDYKAEIIDI